MKKKIILIFVFLILLIIGAMYLIAPIKTEKLSEVKVVDMYGNEILNYNENTMPFTIENENDQIQIYINGKKYNNERIYNVGEYKIIVKDGFKKEKSLIRINEIKNSEENTYKIYVISETLQTLLANLNISSDVNQKGFLWTARTSTINIDKIKNNIPNLEISKNNGELEIGQFKEKVVPELKKYIEKVLNKNPKACFELYMEEDKFYLELELFGKIGLDDSRYDVIMYTNGTLGYVREYEITQNNKYERFKEEKQNYINIVEKIKNNTLETNGYPGSYLVDEKSSVFGQNLNFDYIYISTLVRNNLKLFLQYPKMIVFKDEQIGSEMKNANIIKLVVQDEFAKLENKEKEIFFDNIDLNKKDLDKNYFTDLNKEYLIITGTVPFYGEYKTRLKFENIVKQISKEYGNKYVLLYKPHPRAIPTKEQEKFLNSLNIKVLPGKLPMEAISFIYPNLKLGGFDSSLYLSTDKGKTLFFFAKDKTQLWSPLDVLYDTVFSDAKFYE